MGPSSTVIIASESGPQERLKLDEVLGQLGPRPSPAEDWPTLWIETTKPIGGTYTGEGVPIGVSWIIGEAYEGEDEDHPSWRSDVFTHFGIRAQSRISLSAGCNGQEDHRVLGELTLYLANAFGGIIDFDGALMVLDERPTRHDAIRWLQRFEQANWSEVSGPTERVMAGLPGKIISLPYRTASGRVWVSHVADCEFLKAWLAHPRFHMVK